jgi:hypothetical protein
MQAQGSRLNPTEMAVRDSACLVHRITAPNRHAETRSHTASVVNRHLVAARKQKFGFAPIPGIQSIGVPSQKRSWIRLAKPEASLPPIAIA